MNKYQIKSNSQIVTSIFESKDFVFYKDEIGELQKLKKYQTTKINEESANKTFGSSTVYNGHNIDVSFEVIEDVPSKTFTSQGTVNVKYGETNHFYYLFRTEFKNLESAKSHNQKMCDKFLNQEVLIDQSKISFKTNTTKSGTDYTSELVFEIITPYSSRGKFVLGSKVGPDFRSVTSELKTDIVKIWEDLLKSPEVTAVEESFEPGYKKFFDFISERINFWINKGDVGYNNGKSTVTIKETDTKINISFIEDLKSEGVDGFEKFWTEIGLLVDLEYDLTFDAKNRTISLEFNKSDVDLFVDLFENVNKIKLNDGQVRYYNERFESLPEKYRLNKFYSGIISMINLKKEISHKQKFHLDYLLQNGEPYVAKK